MLSLEFTMSRMKFLIMDFFVEPNLVLQKGVICIVPFPLS